MTDLSGKFTPSEPGPVPRLQVIATLGPHGYSWNITPPAGERHEITIDVQTLEDGSLYINQVHVQVHEL